MNTDRDTYAFGADVGGTFTDLVMVANDGRTWEKKVLSTPPEYQNAVINGLRALLVETEIDPRQIDFVMHGTTVATNAILERRGATTGLITTKGFRDVLELRRMRFPDMYNLFWEKPTPLVERFLRMEVDERQGAHGEIVRPLDDVSVRVAAQRLARERVESIAIVLINSHVNGGHEQRVAEIVAQNLPGVPISISSDVQPVAGEYERTSTTVVNAYLKPVVSLYLQSLIDELAAIGVKGRLFVMQSSGGMLTAELASKYPIYIVESGPAAGVKGACSVAANLGLKAVVTFDMGGTTAKASLILDGKPSLAKELDVGAPISAAARVLKGGGYLVRVPTIDLAEVGAGGGSVAFVDAAGALHVGPRSAGADPGPACYDRGGTEATVTDANVVLGFINPLMLLNGELSINAGKARRAIDAVAGKVGLSLQDTAHGIFRIASSNMMRAIRSVSTERGQDVRSTALCAFGGNGPLFAAELARMLGIQTIIVPPRPGVFSAVGLFTADVERHYFESRPGDVAGIDRDELEAAFIAIESKAGVELESEGWGREEIDFERFAELRYRNQELTLRLIIGRRPGTPFVPESLIEAFSAEYESVFGHRDNSAHVQFVNLGVVARIRGQVRNLSPAPPGGAHGSHATRDVYFGPEVGVVKTPIYSNRAALKSPREGPFILEEYDATLVAPPGSVARTDELGNVLMVLR